MKRADLGCFVSVISHRRPDTVAKMTEIVGPATWFVGDAEDRDMYAQPVEASGGQLSVSGKLCPSRNAALRAAWAEGLPCLELSDDLQRLSVAVSKKTTVPVPLADVVGSMLEACKLTGAFLAGVAPTSNAFYFNPDRPVNTAAFIVGDLILVRPCDLFFDEQLRLKEDYDYTLQHLSKHGCVARVNSVLAAFAHRTNKGGAVAYRTAEREQEAIAHLRAKWGARIRDNPRRPNEILLAL